MFLVKILYRLLTNFSTWVFTITLVLFSISINLTDASLHKETLKKSDFYNKVSNELQTAETEIEDSGFGAIMLDSVFDNLANPGWLQAVAEKNIDLTTDWVSGENEDFRIYIPAKEIEDSLARNLDETTAQFIADNPGQIDVCTPEQAETIKREGFDLERQLCLPESVLSGQQTISEFMEIDSETAQNSDFLNRLISNNPLSPFTDNFKFDDLGVIKNGREESVNFLNTIRDFYNLIIRLIPYLIVLSLILILADLISSRIIKKRTVKEVQRILFYSSISTLALCASIILSMGGTAYMSSYIQDILFPGYVTTEISNLVALEIVKFAFNLVSIAVWVALAFQVLNLLIWIGLRQKIFDNAGSKNQKLFEKKVIYGNPKNDTLAGQFEKLRKERVNQDLRQTSNESEDSTTSEPDDLWLGDSNNIPEMTKEPILDSMEKDKSVDSLGGFNFDRKVSDFKSRQNPDNNLNPTQIGPAQSPVKTSPASANNTTKKLDAPTDSNPISR